MKPIKDFLRTDTDTPVWSKLGRGLGKGEEKYEYSLELTLSLVPIYCWLATLSPEVSQYILVYRLEPQVQILFVQANFARIVQERYAIAQKFEYSKFSQKFRVGISRYSTIQYLIFCAASGCLVEYNMWYDINTDDYIVSDEHVASYQVP